MSTKHHNRLAACAVAGATLCIATTAYAGYSRAQVKARHTSAKNQVASILSNASGAKKTKIQNVINASATAKVGGSQYLVSGTTKVVIPQTNGCMFTLGSMKGLDKYHRYTIYLNDVQSMIVDGNDLKFTKKSGKSRVGIYRSYSTGGNGPVTLNKASLKVRTFSGAKARKLREALQAFKTVCGSSGGAV